MKTYIYVSENVVVTKVWDEHYEYSEHHPERIVVRIDGPIARFIVKIFRIFDHEFGI